MECSDGKTIAHSQCVCVPTQCHTCVANCAGVCIAVSGPCDQLGTGCCSNTASGAQYCSSDAERLTCNVITEGNNTALCELCGGASQPCCFPSFTDATIATSRDLATAFPACQSKAHACMLDPASADYFGMCGCFQHSCNWISLQMGLHMH